MEARFPFKTVADYVGHTSSGQHAKLDRIPAGRRHGPRGAAMPNSRGPGLGKAMRRFVEHKRALNRKYLAFEERALAVRQVRERLGAQAVGGWQQVDSSLIELLQSRKARSPGS